MTSFLLSAARWQILYLKLHIISGWGLFCTMKCFRRTWRFCSLLLQSVGKMSCLFHLTGRCYLGENPDLQILGLLLFHSCSCSVVRISPCHSSLLCFPEDGAGTAPVAQNPVQRRWLEAHGGVSCIKNQCRQLHIYPQDVTVNHNLGPGLLHGLLHAVSCHDLVFDGFMSVVCSEANLLKCCLHERRPFTLS